MVQQRSSQGLRSTLRQGDQDGLCGVYSILNAMTLMLGDRFDQQAAFRCMVRSMGTSCSSIVAYGCTLNQHRRMLLACSDLLMRKRIAMHFDQPDCDDDVTLDRFWKMMMAHYRVHGPGSVLLGLTGDHEHWTCVKSMSPDIIELADSGFLGNLDRSRVTTKDATTARPYGVTPSQCYLLRVNDIKR